MGVAAATDARLGEACIGRSLIPSGRIPATIASDLCGVGLTPATFAAGRAPAPAIDLVNLEAPAAAQSKTGNFTAFNQTVDR